MVEGLREETIRVIRETIKVVCIREDLVVWRRWISIVVIRAWWCLLARGEIAVMPIGLREHLVCLGWETIKVV